MMRRKYLAVLTAIAVVAVSGAAYAQGSSWIHVRVNDDDGTKVSVNLPMSLIEVALDIAGEEAFEGHHGPHLNIGRHHDVSVEDLRRMWAELRETGDAQYVDATDDDEHVSVYRQGDRVFIDVDEHGRQKVRLEVPFSVVDVLLQGDGEELDFVGAIRELARTNNGQIIQVNDGDSSVRIWIDDSNEG